MIHGHVGTGEIFGSGKRLDNQNLEVENLENSSGSDNNIEQLEVSIENGQNGTVNTNANYASGANNTRNGNDNNSNDARDPSLAANANYPSFINDASDNGGASDADADEIFHAKAEERRQTEIRAAKRSIETNLVSSSRGNLSSALHSYSKRRFIRPPVSPSLRQWEACFLFLR